MREREKKKGGTTAEEASRASRAISSPTFLRENEGGKGGREGDRGRLTPKHSLAAFGSRRG